MMKLAKILKALKVAMINLIICSLIQNPFVSNAFAATNSTGFGAQDMMGFANGALNMYGKYLGDKQQMMQTQIAAANNQKLMSDLSPACRKADGTACYTTPAKYFPECTLPASMTTMPVNACSNATPVPAQISAMITYESISQGWMNYYDQMSNEASNAAYPVGVRCLEDKQKAMDSQITEMMNSLQRLQDKLNQDKQVFRDNNKVLLETMNTTNDELFGATKNNLKLKTQDFSKFFSQSCQAVIGKDALKSGTTNGGLNGVLQGLSTTNKSAAEFNSNKSSIESDIRRETDKIAATIKSGGVDDFLSKGYIPQSDESAKTFAALGSQIQKQKMEFETARSRINKVLDSVGYKAPPLDGTFSVDMDEFLADSTKHFKNKFVNDCVTGASSGIAIPIADILKSLEQKSTGSQGTARNDYRIALKRIMDTDDAMTIKMAKIKDLDANYPGMTVTYKDSAQNRVTDTPYDLFMKTVGKCEQSYTQGGDQKKVDRARAALQELKTLNDSYATKVTGAILSQVLDCGGSAMKSGTCSEDSLNTSKDTFCISHATQCANEIQGCYAEANAQVQKRQTKLETLAKTFNANVAAMVTRSNALYEQQKLAVTNMTKLIQERFPGTNFEIPKDMFVSMPELKKDAYGVEMAENGDLTKILEGANSMPDKIDKLKQIFKMQKDAVAKSTSEYIDLQKSAMARERGRWEALLSQCTSMIDTSSKSIQQANNENMKRQGEEDARVAKFCKKYNSISQNPVGACGKAKDLSDTSDQIANRLSNQALSLTEQFASACDGYMNQSAEAVVDCSDKTGQEKKNCIKQQTAQTNKLGDNSTAPNKPIKLSSLCKKGAETEDKDFIAAALKNIPSASAEKFKDLTSVDDVINLMDKENIDDNGFFSDIKDFLSDTGGADKTCSKIKTKTTPAKADIESLAVLKANRDAATKEVDKGTFTADIAHTSSRIDEAKANKLKLEGSILAELATINAPVDTTAKSAQVAALQRIGEQTEGPCDMQNTNTVAKGNAGFDVNSFDSKYLGSSK